MMKYRITFHRNRDKYVIHNKNTLLPPHTAPGQHEHAPQQRRHGHVQRHTVCSGPHLAQDQDGGQHRHGQRGAPGGNQEDLEEDQYEATGPSGASRR